MQLKQKLSLVNFQLPSCLSLILLITLVVFHKMHPFNLLNPNYVNWIYREDNSLLDIGQQVAAQNSFLSQDWRFPPGTLSNLGVWGNNSLLFSDAFPLTAYPIKILNSIFDFHNSTMQFYGINVFFGVLVTVSSAFGFVYWECKSILVASFTSFTIATLPQIFWVWSWPSLQIQGFLILAFWLCRLKDLKIKKFGWPALLFAVSMTHTYFVPMIGLFFLADLIISKKIIGKSTIFFKLIVGTNFVFLGTFLGGGFNAGLRGSSTGLDSIGLYASDWLIYFNSAGISAMVLPVTSIKNLTGFSYPGVGVFLLLLIAIMIKVQRKVIFTKSKNETVSSLFDVKYLFIAGFILFVVSIGPSFQFFGQEHLITENEFFLTPFSIFRVHSRFSWALPLFAIIWAVLILSRSFSHKVVVVIFALLLGVQQLELGNYYQNQKQVLSRLFASSDVSPGVLSSKLNPSIPMYFLPGFPSPLEISWRSSFMDFISEGGQLVNFAYINRFSTKRIQEANERIAEMSQLSTFESNSYLMVQNKSFVGITQRHKLIEQVEGWQLFYIY